jgi:phosphoadenylyl-sulfate reductase (thioredoxin)
MVLLDMALAIDPELQVFTIDTGRLPAETLELIDAIHDRYGRRIEIIYPDADEVSRLVSERGINLFYHSVENRLSCCEVRKVHPLKRRLERLDAWITGLRRRHSEDREAVLPVELDELHGGMVKINPLAGWSTAQVHDYVDQHGVPQNALYGQGYTSIGCAPCTRATVEGEDPRAGRWWWEQGARECGIHYQLAIGENGQSAVVGVRSNQTTS